MPVQIALAAAFVALVIVGIITVLRPEIENRPEDAPGQAVPPDAGAESP